MESNEDDAMKGSVRSRCDSKVESQRHGRMSAEDLREQARWKRNLQFELRQRQPVDWMVVDSRVVKF